MTDRFTQFQGVGSISENWDDERICVLIEVDVVTHDSPWFIRHMIFDVHQGRCSLSFKWDDNFIDCDRVKCFFLLVKDDPAGTIVIIFQNVPRVY